MKFANIGLATMVLIVLVSCTSEETPTPAPVVESESAVKPVLFKPGPKLTEAEAAAFGNRAETVAILPEEARPDADWRDALADELKDEEPKWSQCFEELIIRDFFGDKRGGYFVDVGCFLPREMSTTYWLESEAGWTGMAIDVMEQYRELWKEARPTATFVQKAVSDKDGETLTLHVLGDAENKPLASLDSEFMDSLSPNSQSIDVETATLNTLLEQHGIEKVDFLSIDIEGAEPEALRGFDIAKYKPDLCCIEANKRDEITAYFEANDYELIERYQKADRINLYFRPKPATP